MNLVNPFAAHPSRVAPGDPARQPSGINWKVAAIGTLTLAVTVALAPVGLPSLMVGLLAVATISCAQRWPLMSGAVLIGLFVVVSADESLRSAVTLFSAPFLVASVAFAGRFRAALAFAMVLGYISMTSPFTDKWLPYDLTGTAIYSTTIVAGLWAGIYFRRQRLQHAAYQQRVKAELEEHNERLTTALHDSVATTLTSVIMRAETLGLTSAHNPDVQRTSELIADETRQAMQEVRHLIQVMRDDDRTTAEPLNRTIAEQVAVTSRLLRSHGFDVRGDDTACNLTGSFPPGFEQAFAEIATNAIKYGEPGTAIDISVQETGEHLAVHMSNVVGSRHAPRYLTSRFGLSSARRLVARHGGAFSARQEGEKWIVDMELPTTSLDNSRHMANTYPQTGGDFRTDITAE